MGNATVEQDSFFYLITYQNGKPTEYSVRFRLSDFEPDEKDVYIKIEPIEGYTYGPNDTLGPVHINDKGEGYFDWTPDSEIQTGVSFVCAGNIPPEDTFYKRTEEDKSLTLEKVITGEFPQSEELIHLYYTDQFFVNHDSGATHAQIFINRVKDAILES
jgi:hypothetical protein